MSWKLEMILPVLGVRPDLKWRYCTSSDFLLTLTLTTVPRESSCMHRNLFTHASCCLDKSIITSVRFDDWDSISLPGHLFFLQMNVFITAGSWWVMMVLNYLIGFCESKNSRIDLCKL